MRLEVCPAAAWQPDASRTRQEHYAGATPAERDGQLAKQRPPDIQRTSRPSGAKVRHFYCLEAAQLKAALFQSYVEDECYRWFHVLDFAARFGYRLPFTLTQLS
jgi:hypothetical protein